MWGHIFFHGVQLSSGHLLSTSFLFCWVAPTVVLWLERKGFSWGYCFLVAGHSSTQFGMYEAKRKLTELNAASILFDPRFLDLSSCHLLESSYICFINIMSRCFSCTYWENRRNASTSVYKCTRKEHSKFSVFFVVATVGKLTSLLKYINLKEIF